MKYLNNYALHMIIYGPSYHLTKKNNPRPLGHKTCRPDFLPDNINFRLIEL